MGYSGIRSLLEDLITPWTERQLHDRVCVFVCVLGVLQHLETGSLATYKSLKKEIRAHMAKVGGCSYTFVSI